MNVSWGTRADPAQMVTVAVCPEPRVMPPGGLSADEFAQVRRWIALNRQVLVDYWTGEIAYTEDALAALRPLAAE